MPINVCDILCIVAQSHVNLCDGDESYVLEKEGGAILYVAIGASFSLHFRHGRHGPGACGTQPWKASWADGTEHGA